MKKWKKIALLLLLIVVVFGFLFASEIGTWLDKETAKNNANKITTPKNITILANSTNKTSSTIDLT